MEHVTILEKRLKPLMKEIFKEKFENQQKLIKSISEKFDITLTEMRKVLIDINNLQLALNIQKHCWKKKLLEDRKKQKNCQNKLKKYGIIKLTLKN